MVSMVTAEEQARGLQLVRDLKDRLCDVIQHINEQMKKLKQRDWSTAKGLSFLEVKNQLLLSYLINLSQLLGIKAQGRQIAGESSIDRLVEIRTVLEKMQPIDKKLKYQIDKLLKTATTGTLGENDPLRFKPNPENLQNKLDDGSGEESDEAETSSKIYKPPKLSAVTYDAELTAEEKQEKDVQRARQRALSSSVMRELRQEYFDGPEEIRDTADLHRRREDRAGKERTEYEEKYLIRTAVSKKERNEARRLRTMSGLDDITRFGDIGALTGESDHGEPSRKRRKSTPSKKKSKAAKKWKRKK